MLKTLSPKPVLDESFSKDRLVFKSDANSFLEFKPEEMRRERVVAKVTRFSMF